jgi:hypothetical protein
MISSSDIDYSNSKDPDSNCLLSYALDIVITSGTFGSLAILFMLGIIKRKSTKQANEDPANTLTIS